MSEEIWTAGVLARIFTSSDWTPRDMEKAGLAALGRKKPLKWLQNLIADIHERSPTPYAPSPDTLTRLIVASNAFRGLRLAEREWPLFERVAIPRPKFAPAPVFHDTGVPELATLDALAAWLNFPVSQIEWFADIEGYRAFATAETTRHYGYHWIPRRTGPARLIEAPKPFLKSIQRQILRDILDRIPVHDCAHGFRKRRSCITGAHLHAGEHVVIAADLKDFFPGIPLRRVHGLFRSLGYPWAIARILAGLCSTATPAEVFERPPADTRPDRETQRLFRQQHLPQGAPTSPALANLCAWRLDCRLDGLAKRLNARYTRYGDDLAFSGDREFAGHADRFLAKVTAICGDEGLAVNPRKTRIMRQGGRQRLTGLVVNRHVNIARDQYDRLKAIVFNCARHGPADQNRERHPDFRAHLDGRITWVENVNPRKGHRLRLLFQQIDWS